MESQLAHASWDSIVYCALLHLLSAKIQLLYDGADRHTKVQCIICIKYMFNLQNNVGGYC